MRTEVTTTKAGERTQGDILALLDEFEEFIDGFVDGAPDASSTSKQANYLKCEITVLRYRMENQ